MKRGDPKVLKLERQLNLVSYLLSARAPVPFSEVRGKVVGYDDDASPDAVEKRFDRDKADLRAIGVNIEYISNDLFGRAGYVIDPQGYFLRQTDLEPEDAMLLAVLQRTLGIVDDALGRNLKSALAKLTIDNPLPEPLRTSVGEQHLLTLGRPEHGPRPPAHRGPRRGRRPPPARVVQVPHGRCEPDRGAQRSSPYGLGLVDGNWHLWSGYDEDREPDAQLPPRSHPRQGQGDSTSRTTHTRSRTDFNINGPRPAQEEFDIGRGARDRGHRRVRRHRHLAARAPAHGQRVARGAGRTARATSRSSIRNEEGFYRWVAEFGQRATHRRSPGASRICLPRTHEPHPRRGTPPDGPR